MINWCNHLIDWCNEHNLPVFLFVYLCAIMCVPMSCRGLLKQELLSTFYSWYIYTLSSKQGYISILWTSKYSYMLVGHKYTINKNASSIFYIGTTTSDIFIKANSIIIWNLLSYISLCGKYRVVRKMGKICKYFIDRYKSISSGQKNKI